MENSQTTFGNVSEFCRGYGIWLFEVEEEGIVNADKSVYELFQYYNDEIIWATNQNGYYAVSSAMKKEAILEAYITVGRT